MNHDQIISDVMKEHSDFLMKEAHGGRLQSTDVRELMRQALARLSAEHEKQMEAKDREISILAESLELANKRFISKSAVVQAIENNVVWDTNKAEWLVDHHGLHKELGISPEHHSNTKTYDNAESPQEILHSAHTEAGAVKDARPLNSSVIGNADAHVNLPVDLMKEDMLSLPFVRWDRFIVNFTERSIDVYGWIKREDSHEDFVILTYEEQRDKVWTMRYSTSSAQYDKEIFKSLKCEGDAPNKCERVEDLLDIPNVIRIHTSLASSAGEGGVSPGTQGQPYPTPQDSPADSPKQECGK